MIVEDPRKKTQARALTFTDKGMLGIQRNIMESMQRSVVNSAELPLVKELVKYVNKLYYSIESPIGIVKLVSVSLEGTTVFIIA